MSCLVKIASLPNSRRYPPPQSPSAGRTRWFSRFPPLQALSRSKVLMSMSVCLSVSTHLRVHSLSLSFSLSLPLSLSTSVFWKIYLCLKTWLLSKKQRVSTKTDWIPGEKTPLDNPLTNLRVSVYASGENLVLCSFSSGPTRANQSCACVSHMSVLPPPPFYMGCLS